MNSKLALTLILIAVQSSALSASALEHKHHHRAADRAMTARNDTQTQYVAPRPAWTPVADNPSDPPANANGN